MNPNIYNMQNYILKSMGKTMDVMGIQNTWTGKKEYENLYHAYYIKALSNDQIMWYWLNRVSSSWTQETNMTHMYT